MLQGSTGDAQYFGLGGPAHPLIVAAFILLTMSATLVWNRIFWRLKNSPSLGLDDVLIAVALIFLFCLTVSTVAAVNAGYGRNSREESMNEATIGNALKWFWIYQITYKATLCATKTSILSFYLRVFAQFHWFYNICRATFWLVLIHSGTGIIVSILQCSPVSRAWTPPPIRPSSSNPTRDVVGHRIDLHAFWLTNATFNIITDFAITLTIPAVVWAMASLQPRQKFALTGLLCLSLFAASTSIVRATSFPHSPPTGAENDTSDPTSSTYRSTYWSTIEASLAIICACIPMLRLPLNRLVSVSSHLTSTMTTDPNPDPELTTVTTPPQAPPPALLAVSKPPPREIHHNPPPASPRHKSWGRFHDDENDVLILIDAFPAVPSAHHPS